MSRVKIEIPSKKPFYISKIPIRITDMNYGNHLGNESFLVLAQEARVNWLMGLSYSELDLGGVGLIMTDAMVVYKREGHYGVQVEIKLYSNDITNHSFDLYYEVMGNGLLLAQIKTGMLAYDYEKKKVSSFSASFLRVLKET